MLVCTEHGVFAYDGRRFINLGANQGLREGGYVYGLAAVSTGRVVVEFSDQIFVSDRPLDASHPSSSLSFRMVPHPGVSFYDERPHRVASWKDGVVILAGDAAIDVTIPDFGPSHIETMGYDRQEQSLLAGATAIFSVRGSLWEAFSDGRLCAADPGAVKCYAADAGLHGGPWLDVVAGDDGRVLARSASSVATFDPASNRWSVVDLPDQGGRYDNYSVYLGIFKTPGGGFLTQADHGLAVLGLNGWHVLTVKEGAPSGDIVSAITDSTGQLWFHILGRGLVRWVGYGHWESLQKADGLSDDVVWESVRPPGGALWVATDTGIDEIVRRGPALEVGKVFPGPSFVLAVGPRGRLWSSFGRNGVRIIDPADNSVTKIGVPPVNAIVSDSSGSVWLGTETGLFRVNDQYGVQLRAVIEGSPGTQVLDIAPDDAGGVFYLAGGRLRHRRPDGNDAPVGGAWPAGGFQPAALAVGHDGELWIGGAGGLFRLVVSNDRVSSYNAVPTSDTRTNTVAAVMVDHRGWTWVGTALGVSVFNGTSWVSVDADAGLLSDDVDQDGIREDADGSIWIATSKGLAHLLDPSSLFNSQPLDVVVSQALLGSKQVVGHWMPYTQDALSVQFGTPNYDAEKSVVFRYRLSGVDAGWVDSPTGAIRYPFVPPGHHVLTVVGYDEMTHRASAPTTLVVDVGYPWWRQWWAEAIWALAVAGLIYGAMRIRLRVVLAVQKELKRRVEVATEEVRLAQSLDRLTGLLNRCEIERRLAEKLARGPAGEEIVVALLDVDHFKRVNDTHGHLGGDDVLRAMGRLIARSVRGGEYAGRYGGEEILLVLNDCDGRGAERVLDLHLAIRHDTFDAAGAAIHVTCSIGVAWAVQGDNWESLIGRADEALYQAKHDGRDRVAESRLAKPSLSGAPAISTPDARRQGERRAG